MRLLADAMLGRLARLLRMCGHDAAYALDRNVEADGALLALAESEGRVVVTRDRQLAERASESVLLESKDVDEQLREVAAAGVSLDPTPGERCGACNGVLERDETTNRPDYVPDDADPVWRCRDCDQRFWTGSHWEDVEKRVAGL